MATMKTKTGQVLTEEMSEALAREAEAGYDPATLRPRRAGRPPLGDGPSWRVQFRVDAATYATLQARARTEKREISEIARTALERYLHGEPAKG
jgi:hypothetical protein